MFLAAGVTLGWSEGAAQEGEATRIAVTAARIAALIDRLAASCRLAAEGISASSYRAAQVSAALRPLLNSRVIVAMADTADALPVVRAETRLVKASEVDANLQKMKSAMSVTKLKNFERYVKKLPSGAREPTITGEANGTLTFSAQVPGRVPGPYATYTKIVDSDGTTTSFIKMTVGPDGSIVHVKVKYP